MKSRSRGSFDGGKRCSNQTKTTMRTRIYRLNSVHLVIIQVLLILLCAGVSGNTDWLQNCGNCHCNWNSGKRTADCKNKSLHTIPIDLSQEMQVVDFSHNPIAELRREQFKDAKLNNLHKIYMRNCTMQEVHRDAFAELYILIELDLSNNQIRYLHPGTFKDLNKLRKFFVNNNNLEVLESNLFRDMKFLMTVEFKGNRLKQIEINTFVNVPVLSAIHLESNNLTILHKETFDHIPKLLHLSLAQNPWNCSCELQQFRDYALSKRLYTPPTDCQEPRKLRDKLWSDIPSEHFACRPRIIQPRPGSYLEAISENVTITCRVSGSPRPNIFWMYKQRPINPNDQRLQIQNSMDQQQQQRYPENRHDDFYAEILISDLIIHGIRTSDKGSYTCIAENSGGKDESSIQLFVNADRLFAGGIGGGGVADSTSNLLLIVCIVAFTLLLLLIVIVLVLLWYCRRIKHYTKDSTMSENGLISSKIDKSHNGSVLEGSVIVEMQKSLLTEVNPVEKPPRRTDIESIDMDDGHEIKKTLLDETPFGSHDEETHSIALSDTTPRSRQTFVDDGYGTNLPPDLLSFPARVAQSPSLQSSMSNIPDNRIYGKSPLSSPVYQHINPNNIYGTKTPSGFMTLQHPKSRNLAMVAAVNRNQSPFMPAPVVYSPVLKQGYMTIPRKPRVPSWAPSNSTQLSEFQSPTSPNPSETGTASTSEFLEPVYDNLGLRTTAGGNSVLNLNKIGQSQQTPIRYTMKDRPLPATPLMAAPGNASDNSLTHTATIISTPNNNTLNLNNHHNNLNNNNNNNLSNISNNLSSAKIYEPIHELTAHLSTTSDTEPLYGTARSHAGVTIVPSGTINLKEKNLKIPPRPPPKPKKKNMSVTSTGQGSTSQLFEDEGEDGTEV